MSHVPIRLCLTLSMESTPMLASRKGRRTGVRPSLPWALTKVAAAASVAMLASGVLAGCTASSATGTTGTTSQDNSTGPITIGASLSLDGQRSADGVAFKRGYELWASDINARGGLLGRQVKLVILNDDSSPITVVSNYQKLIGQDHVDLTFGPYSSLLTTPASAVAARYGYAFVEGAGGAPAVFDTPLNQADRNVFDVSQPVADSMLPLVNYIKKLPPSQRPKTAAFPCTEDPFAAPPVQFAETLLKSIGIKSYSFPPFVESPATDQAAAQAVASTNA